MNSQTPTDRGADEFEVRYDPETALVVVDVQNDFADPKGSLYVAGGEAIIPFVNGQIDAAQAGGATTVYTQDWHPPSTPHFDTDGGLWPVHCVRETWGARLHPALVVAGEVVRKGTGGEDGYSGFTVRDPASGAEASTGLGELLTGRGITKLVVVGLAGDVCVKATVLDGRRLGFRVTVLDEGCRDVELEAGDGRRARQAMQEAGALVA